MRKLAIIGLIVLLAIALVSVSAYAGKGNPETAQQGNESGKAQQAGPGGPNYHTPTPPPPEIVLPIVPPSEEGGTVYRVYLPFVASRVASAPESVSANFTVQWK